MFKCYKCGHKQRDPGKCEICGSLTAYLPDNFSEMNASNIVDLGGEGVWRYAPLLPSFKIKVSLGEGMTPMLKAERLSKLLGINLFIKNESVNPTGSYLDRGSAVALSYAASSGKQQIICKSLGNISASVAAYSVRAGLGCILYYDEARSLGKLYQTLAYGARAIKGKPPENFPENYYITGESDSYFLTGMKTLSYEIIEKQKEKIDYVFISVGEGGGISMLYAGFQDMSEILKIRIPSLVGVYLTSKSEIADDLAVEGLHSDLANFSINVTNGFKIKVDDDEIIDAEKLLARAEGMFAEPSAAVALAGLIKAVDWNLIPKNSNVVYVLTGSGLKDPISIGTLLGIKEKKALESVNDTKKSILHILYVSPSYGYEIWKKLKELGVEKTLPDVYVALKKLEAEGFIKSKTTTKNGRTSKVYELTDKGKKYVEVFLT